MVTPITATIYIELIDYDGSGRPLYQGWAQPNSGTASTDAVWRIQKMGYDATGRINSRLFADSNANFDNLWEGRTVAPFG